MNTTDNAGAPLYVSSPLLPDLSDYNGLLAEIWATGHVTNDGPFNRKLEAALKEYLGVPTALTFNNGTIALLAALKMFNLRPGSEVVTTPMTFAATAHAVAWNGLTPVFADVLESDLTIDPAAVEKAITKNTTAILATHVYGSICDLDALQDIANRYNLKLIYDAAHAFGVTVNGRPIASFGDATVFSFHATKLFNTIEGGALATPNAEDQQRGYLLRNFGIKNEEEVVEIGINGKMNELQAAIGLLNLELVEKEVQARAELRQSYMRFLTDLPGITVQRDRAGVVSSQQYFPLVIDPDVFGRSRDDIYDELKAQNIFARKYFHPICTDFEPYKGCEIVSCHNTPYAEVVKKRVLCLPFHSHVSEQHIRIVERVFC